MSKKLPLLIAAILPFFFTNDAQAQSQEDNEFEEIVVYGTPPGFAGAC